MVRTYTDGLLFALKITEGSRFKTDTNPWMVEDSSHMVQCVHKDPVISDRERKKSWGEKLKRSYFQGCGLLRVRVRLLATSYSDSTH